MSARRSVVSRGAYAPARRTRGEPTLIGVGPAMFRPAAPPTAAEAPTRRVLPAREPCSRAAEPPPPCQEAPRTAARAPAPDRRPSTRLDSAVSGSFFREGELQEANGWEGSPLLDAKPDVSFRSFDRIPRRRWPMAAAIVLILGVAGLAIGAVGLGAGGAHVMAAVRRGARAMLEHARAETETAIPAVAGATPAVVGRPEPVAPATRAWASPLAVAAPSAFEAGTTPAEPGPLAPGSPARRPSLDGPGRAPGSSRSGAAEGAAPPEAVQRSSSRPAAFASRPAAPRLASRAGDDTDPPAPSTQPRPGDRGKVRRGFPPPRHGLVWSPSAQRLVPAEPAPDGNPPTGTDHDVLPLDDSLHSTLP